MKIQKTLNGNELTDRKRAEKKKKCHKLMLEEK